MKANYKIELVTDTIILITDLDPKSHPLEESGGACCYAILKRQE